MSASPHNRLPGLSVPEMFFSLDVETDGPIPGRNSMLSFAVEAFDDEGKPTGLTWSCNLETLPEASPDPETAKWWSENQAAYDRTRVDTDHVDRAMVRFVEWVESTAKMFHVKPVCVAYPAAFDFGFLRWYMIAFAKRSPFGHNALDLRTLACTLLGIPFHESSVRNFPKRWLQESQKRAHVASDDAREQGLWWAKMWQERKREKKTP